VKLYAIRDRMIDYFMVPFACPDDHQAMAGVSQEVNREDITAAIQQAPHHFELYSLGEIDENGTIFPHKELLCDCSSLVRARRQPAESGAPDSLKEIGRRIERPGGAGGNSGTAS